MEEVLEGALSGGRVRLYLEEDVHYPLLVLQRLLVVLKVFKSLGTSRKAVIGNLSTAANRVKVKWR